MSSLYLHIPFCRSRCPYCDFYSQLGSPAELAEYVELLGADLRLQAAPDASPLQTVFFGGGTPSLLSGKQVERLLTQIDSSFGLAEVCEISLEANPGYLDLQRLRDYHSAGVNRLSLGIQSLCDDQLRLLGRKHDSADAHAAVSLARRAGFTNLSLDLMFARPGLTCRQLEAELEQLLGLQPEHVSLYGLSYEQGTRFTERLALGELQDASEDEYADQYLLIHEQLAAAGFKHYEISNFARPGFACRHNQVYWRRQTCLAAGCGAHSFFSDGWGERWAIPADLPGYRRCLQQGRHPAQQIERFDRRGAMVETIYLALRTSEGLDGGAFADRFGIRPEAAFPDAFLRLRGHLDLSGKSWSLRPSGWLLYDHLISAFF